MRTRFGILSLLVSLVACKPGTESTNGASGLMEFATGSASQEDVKSSVDEATGKVRFYYLHDGQELTYEPMHDGDVTAAKVKDGVWKLSYMGVVIGEKHGDLLKVCDEYALEGGTVVFPCNAIFYHQEQHPPKDATGQYASRFLMDISLAEVGASGLQLQEGTYDGRVDLSAHARNQINQRGTGTCYYNSITGLLEIFHHMKTGQGVDLSEPDVLANLAFAGQTESLYMGIVPAGKLSLLTEAEMPFAKYYTGGFEAASAAARRDAKSLRQAGAQVVSLALATKGEKLFWYGRWQSGHVTDADFQKTADWLVANKQPVHLQHVVNGYWHAVIMLGYDPATKQVLIKDSLGNTHIKGSWKSKEWFKKWAYGAVGASAGGAAGVQPPVTQPPVTQPPTVEPPAAGAYKVAAVLGAGTSASGQKPFSLRLDATAAALAEVTKVVYHVHATFGTAEYSTITAATGGFQTQGYTTYSRSWQTGGAKVHLKNGTVVDVAGAQVSW